MNPNSRVYKIEYANELLRLAAEDLDSAKILFAGKGKAENTLYHVEQVVEKCLKAVLCARRKALPMSHDIGAILSLIDGPPPPGAIALADLTPYATIRRYEEGSAIIEVGEVQSAIAMSEQVLSWAQIEVRKLLK